jgi:bifunctional non-homologous end joining protein LigD
VITHPEKVLFPDEGITKGELAAYYEAIAPLMLPHIKSRPITMERFPGGIGATGFLQKNVVKGFPSWLKRVEAPKKDGVVHYPIANDRRSLEWIVNQNTIALHVWVSRAPKLGHPDLCVFDLDPSRDDADDVREGALRVRDVLAELGHDSLVKTSGSKGFHIAVRLGARATFRDSHALAGQAARILLERHPAQFTQEFSKADRKGRIYLDTGRNQPGATFVAVYSVRAKAGAPVSAPCTWEEIESGEVQPRTFTLRTMAARVAKVGDLWTAAANKRRRPVSKRTGR